MLNSGLSALSASDLNGRRLDSAQRLSFFRGTHVPPRAATPAAGHIPYDELFFIANNKQYIIGASFRHESPAKPAFQHTNAATPNPLPTPCLDPLHWVSAL